MSYQQTGETDHSGDGLLTLSNGSEILVEIKNYSTVVNDDEINKFTFDMKTTKIKFGLFISLATKINKMTIKLYLNLIIIKNKVLTMKIFHKIMKPEEKPIMLILLMVRITNLVSIIYVIIWRIPQKI